MASFSIRGALDGLRRDIKEIQSTIYPYVVTSTVKEAQHRLEMIGEERLRQLKKGLHPKPVELCDPLKVEDIVFTAKARMVDEGYELYTRIQATIQKDIRNIIKQVSDEDADLLGQVSVELERELTDIFTRAVNQVEKSVKVHRKGDTGNE